MRFLSFVFPVRLRRFASVLVAFSLVAALPSIAAPRALLVGINDYGDPELNLEGSCNDVALVKRVLVRQYGFPEANVIVLTDRAATTARIVDTFKQHLIRDCRPGDSAFFYFTGHGSFTVDLDGDEPDALDECIVTSDTVGRAPETWLTDDVLNELFQRVPTQHLLTVLDCCHSGTGNRDAKGRSARPAGEPKIRFRSLDFSELNAASKAPKPDGIAARTVNPHHIFISACRADQVAYETDPVPGSERHGLFTQEFCNLLSRDQGELTFAQAATVMKQQFERTTAGRPPGLQTPAFEGGHLSSTLKQYLAATEAFPAPSGPPPSPGRPGRTLDEIASGYQPGGTIGVRLATDKPQYVEGDLMRVTVSVDADCYLRLYHLAADNTVTQIFPNRRQADNFVRAGEQVAIPGKGAPFQFRMKPPFGNEVIKAVASTRQFTDADNLRFQNDLFKQFHDIGLAPAAKRGLEVEDAAALFGENVTIYSVRPK